MKINNKQLGFDENLILEVIVFTDKILFDKSLKYAIRHKIQHVVRKYKMQDHYEKAIILSREDALIFKPGYTKFQDLKTDLLT